MFHFFITWPSIIAACPKVPQIENHLPYSITTVLSSCDSNIYYCIKVMIIEIPKKKKDVRIEC